MLCLAAGYDLRYFRRDNDGRAGSVVPRSGDGASQPSGKVGKFKNRCDFSPGGVSHMGMWASAEHVGARPRQMSTHLENEKALVVDAQAGSREAFAKLLNQYDRRLFRLALNITGNQEDAADVLQEAFLKAYKSLGTFRGDSRFYTWLFQIVVNESRGKLRKRRRTDFWVSLDEPVETDDQSGFMPREIEDWGDNPEQRYSKTELHEILERNMKQLEPALRVVFLLRDVEGLSIAETAAMLDLSVPAVKSRMLRARLKLRELLTQYFRRG